jgi:hypothetical protein
MKSFKGIRVRVAFTILTDPLTRPLLHFVPRSSAEKSGSGSLSVSGSKSTKFPIEHFFAEKALFRFLIYATRDNRADLTQKEIET